MIGLSPRISEFNSHRCHLYNFYFCEILVREVAYLTTLIVVDTLITLVCDLSIINFQNLKVIKNVLRIICLFKTPLFQNIVSFKIKVSLGVLTFFEYPFGEEMAYNLK